MQNIPDSVKAKADAHYTTVGGRRIRSVVTIVNGAAYGIAQNGVVWKDVSVQARGFSGGVKVYDPRSI